jgi:hypothetical protein
MASIEELQTLRTLALDEQYSAAVEQRQPDRDLLDGLGKLVLPDFAFVMCEADYAYHQRFDPEEGHVITKIDRPTSVFGRFGGFFSRVVEVQEDDEVIEVEKVLYHVMNDRYMDTGFLFPVENTSIADAHEALKDDPTFQELTYELGQEKIAIKKIAEIIERSVYGPDAPIYHGAYVQLSVSPKDLFSWVQAGSCLALGFSDEFHEGVRTDLVGMHIEEDHGFGILQIDSKRVLLSIMKEGMPSIVMPVSYLCGYVATELLQVEL